jgi:hypothetical protein
MSAQSREPRTVEALTTATTLRVEDLFFISDLRALDIPWVDGLLAKCESYEDLARVSMLIRCWGPDEEDVESTLGLSPYSSRLKEEAEKLRQLVLAVERWRS